MRHNNGDRPTAYILIGVAVGVTLMFLALFAIPSGPQHGEREPTTQHQSKPETKNDNPPKSLWQATFDDPVALYTAVLCVFTAILAGVSGVQIYFLRRSDETARISANAARSANEINIKNVIADQRAWIIMHDFEIEDISVEGRSVVYFPAITWKNIGKSPALHCKTRMEITLEMFEVPNLLQNLAASELASYNQAHTRIAVPGKTYVRRFGLGTTEDGPFWRTPSIYGVITYTSGIDNSVHQTGFAVNIFKRHASGINRYGGNLPFEEGYITLDIIGWDETTGGVAT